MAFEQAKGYAEHFGKRLPTIQQWCQAAFGNKEEKYPWGNEGEQNRCNSQEFWKQDPTNKLKHVTPVMEFNSQNEFGLHDLIGNTKEIAILNDGNKGCLCGISYDESIESLNPDRQACSPKKISSDNAAGFRCIVTLDQYQTELERSQS